jgi:hypothetical protein
VFPAILQHVDERVTHLARCREVTRVMPLCPDASAPPERPIHRLRHPDRQSLDAAAKHHGVISFDEHMHVIDLDAELKKSEASG